MFTNSLVPAPLESLDTRLDNGLRVVVCPDRSVPVVCVAVCYDVGSRSEPAGRNGFAHLFEHLMFQGSVNLEKMAHARLVEETGGNFNASTRADNTVYHQIMPSGGLERALFLEADRMRRPTINEKSLRNQVDVVSEEIRANMLNVPYGGFPRARLRPVMFETFPNAHEGYGSFQHLRSATTADAEDFFTRYYGTENAVLCVTGDLDAELALGLVRKYFGDIEKRQAPARPSFDEPDLAGPRHQLYTDSLAPLPALTCGWRVPDPADLPAFVPYVVLAEVLAGNDQCRLVHRMVRGDRVAVAVSAAVNLLGDPFCVRHPTGLWISAHLSPEAEAERALNLIAEECERLGARGPDKDELARVKARMRARTVRNLDDLRARTIWMATFAQQRDRPGLGGELTTLVEMVTPAQIAAAAASLVPARRASVEVVPGATG